MKRKVQDCSSLLVDGGDSQQSVALKKGKKFKSPRSLLDSKKGHLRLNADHDSRNNNKVQKLQPKSSSTSSPPKSCMKKTSPVEPPTVTSPDLVSVVTDDERKPVTKKELRFCNMVVLVQLPAYSQKEKEAVFISPQDAVDMRDEIRRSSRCMSFPEFYTVDEQAELLMCTRGITSAESMKDRSKRKKFVKKVVLYAQARNQVPYLTTMRSDDDYDSADSDEYVWFVEPFRTINEEAAMQAQAAAREDEQEALAVYMEATTVAA